MKNMIKMSLVAAVAVAGLTTTSSAANLEDAVKGTQLNGYVRYRLNTNHEAANSTAVEETKAVMKFTTTVNDSVKANVKMVSFADTGKGNTSANTAITEGNFVINAGSATVIAGLQTSQSPFFANNGDTRSHGVTALIPAGAATIAAAHYTTTVAAKGAIAGVTTNDISALGLIGKAGSASYQAWYAVGHDGFSDVAATNLQASAKVGALNIAANYSNIDLGDDSDNGMMKLVVSGKAGKIGYVAAVAQTEADSGMVSLDGDDDAKADLAMYNNAMSRIADATGILVGASAPVGPVKVSLNHLMVSTDDMDATETDIKVAYKMSKNFSGYVRYGVDGGDSDNEASRIEVKYTF